MKRLFLLFYAILLGCTLINCSSTDEYVDENLNEVNEHDFTEYLYECTDFVEFSPNSNFLQYLISKGFDLNYDGKISCFEASQITHLDLGNDPFSTNIRSLKGIEAFVNLEVITGDVNYVGVSGGEVNLYNCLNLKSIEVSSTLGVNGTYPYAWTIILPNSSSLKTINTPEANLGLKNTSNLTGLDTLIVKGTGGNSGKLDLSKSDKLKILYIGSSSLSEIKLSQTINTYLTEITIYSNGLDSERLSEINLSNVPNLKKLVLVNNLVEELNLTNNNNIEYLDVRHNKLSILNVSNLNAIKYLDASDNNLGAIILSQNINNLHTLKVSNNLITNLDLSHCVSLTDLRCDNNIIESLNLVNNNHLERASLENNHLNYLDLRNGNIEIITYMNARQNNLDCIYIEEGFSPPVGWWKDENSQYCY